MRRIVDTATRVIPDANAVRASLIAENRPHTAATTDSRLADVLRQTASADDRGLAADRRVTAALDRHADTAPLG
ncbi:hypothetical protein JNUCC0626_07270 [Lentzea sp. JNUCC 0626]|uniref:hypothetical protein n=1 Tax=Lentzea sp. JNUCC 0626 TaxID=3367513 RepID=UPI00374A6DD4